MAFGGPMEATTTVPVLIHRAAFSDLRIGRAATISMFMVAILMVSTILYTLAYSKSEEQLSN